MAGSFKLFQFVQQWHQAIGIYPSQSNQWPSQINSTNVIFLFCCAQFAFTTIVFLFVEATSMFEYGLAFFGLIGIINGIVIYLIFIWQSQNTLDFIKNCNRFIEKRMFCSELGRLDVKLNFHVVFLCIFCRSKFNAHL